MKIVVDMAIMSHLSDAQEAILRMSSDNAKKVAYKEIQRAKLIFLKRNEMNGYKDPNGDIWVDEETLDEVCKEADESCKDNCCSSCCW